MNKILKYDLCPIRDIIARLSDKWSLLIIMTLYKERTARFSEIQKELEDISPRMLTVTLRSLESDGIVSRKVYAEIPPRVEYKLTELGKSLIMPLNGLVEWALNNKSEIIENRSK